MSTQLESRHFFRENDVVQRRDGLTGRVVRGWSLYALVSWVDGREEEVDQFDPRVVVLERAEPR